MRGVSTPRVLGRFFGRAPDFRSLYDLFDKAGANVARATALLAEVIERWPDDGPRGRLELVEHEHEGDRITHDIIHHLYRSAVTPFREELILSLASELDDIVDLAEEVADFMTLYRVEAPTDHAIRLAAVLQQAGAEVAAALGSLDDVSGARAHVVEVNRLEDEGDRLEREAVASLFDGGIDPMVVVRWKDIYQRLDNAIDACKHVAQILEGLAVQQA